MDQKPHPVGKARGGEIILNTPAPSLLRASREPPFLPFILMIAR
jgi:hypothetical protein